MSNSRNLQIEQILLPLIKRSGSELPHSMSLLFIQVFDYSRVAILTDRIGPYLTRNVNGLIISCCYVWPLRSPEFISSPYYFFLNRVNLRIKFSWPYRANPFRLAEWRRFQISKKFESYFRKAEITFYSSLML